MALAVPGLLLAVFIANFSEALPLFFLPASALSLIFAYFYRDTIYAFFALFFIFIFAGALAFSLYKSKMDSKTQILQEANLSGGFVARIAREPDKRTDKTFLALEFCIKDNCATLRGKYYGYKDFKFGDSVKVYGKIIEPENFDEHFNYKGFLLSQAYSKEFLIKEIELVKEGRAFLRTLYKLKQDIIAALYDGLSFNSASLASGILLGEKQALLPEYKDAFKKSGLMHIVVLSGYNIGIVATFIFWIFFFLNRRLRALISVLIIILFVLMVGSSLPALRAGSMGALAFLAIALRREAEALYLLYLTAFFFILFNPFLALYDPGFQMSFLVTLAIVLFAKPLQERILAHFSFLKSYFAELLSSSLIASVFVSPILIYYTGYLSLIGIVANLLVLFVLPFAMLFAFLSALFEIILPAFNLAFAFIAEFLLGYILAVSKWVASLPFATVNLQLASLPVFIFYAGFIAYASRVLWKK